MADSETWDQIDLLSKKKKLEKITIVNVPIEALTLFQSCFNNGKLLPATHWGADLILCCRSQDELINVNRLTLNMAIIPIAGVPHKVNKKLKELYTNNKTIKKNIF